LDSEEVATISDDTISLLDEYLICVTEKAFKGVFFIVRFQRTSKRKWIFADVTIIVVSNFFVMFFGNKKRPK